MPTSVRLDTETEDLLRSLAQRSGRTKSDILREALARLAADQEMTSENENLYSLVADLVGVAEGGPRNLARQHKRAFREALRKKHRK